MFPDCEIAKNFQCGSTKPNFVTIYGLAPYFHSFLFQKISSSPHQVVSFDESLNNSVQKGQMDLLKRYWGKDTDVVTWDLNLWHGQPLTMYLRSFRIGFLRLMTQRLCKYHLMELMST